MPGTGRAVSLVVLLWVTFARALWAAPPGATPVSPGAPDRVTELAWPCPTFSWGGNNGSAGYEVAVLELRDHQPATVVLRRRIAAGATSWTPSREECLAAGHEYAWVVRPAAPKEAAWSAPLRFRVPAAPTPEELTAAVAVLERWRASGGVAARAVPAAPEDSQAPAGPTGAKAATGTTSNVSVGGSAAAIRGEIPDTSGAAFGVLGISHSSQGAGLVARNETGGADLILDGAATTEVDTIVTQAGIDRSSAAAQTFNIHNSGAGGMTLQVDGVPVDTTSTTIDWSRLVSVPALQQRVTGSCPVGQAIGGVNEDGSVLCYELPRQPNFATVDSSAGVSVGDYNSIAIGSDGLPVISYHDYSASALKVAKCTDATCFGKTVTTVDDPADAVGEYTSIRIGNDGLPVISYYDRTAGALDVAKCTSADCSTRTINVVDDPANDVGQYGALVIGDDGFPVISYDDVTAGSLEIAKCNDAACATRTIHTVDTAAGAQTSIAIGNDGFPVISYYDAPSNELRVAKCNDAACAGNDEVITVLTTTAYGDSSIAIGVDGLPWIAFTASYGFSTLGFVRCDDDACTTSTIGTVDTNPLDHEASIAVGSDGLPLISYSRSGSIKVAKGTIGGTWAIADLVAIPEDDSAYTSIAIGADHLPVIAYDTHGTLQVAKCKNTSCFF